MRRYYEDDNSSKLKGQSVDWGGGGYVQTGNVDIRQEQSVHVHVHIHINEPVEETILPETVKRISLLGRVLRLLSNGRRQALPEKGEQQLPTEAFDAIMNKIVEELDRGEE